jgi:hypothetical protein
MFPFDYIDPVYFLIAFCIGLLFSYVTSTANKIVIKYPTPENSGKITYKDDAGLCYKYKVVEEQCPFKAKQIPIQI